MFCLRPCSGVDAPPPRQMRIATGSRLRHSRRAPWRLPQHDQSCCHRGQDAAAARAAAHLGRCGSAAARLRAGSAACRPRRRKGVAAAATAASACKRCATGGRNRGHARARLRRCRRPAHRRPPVQHACRYRREGAAARRGDRDCSAVGANLLLWVRRPQTRQAKVAGKPEHTCRRCAARRAQADAACSRRGPRMLPRLVLSKKRWNLTGLLGKPPFDVAGADARLSDDGECSSSDDGECSSSDDDPYCNHCGQECSGDIGWWHCELCGEFLCDDCRDMVLIDQNILFGVSCDICGGYMCTACHPGWLMCQGEDCNFEVVRERTTRSATQHA